MFLKILKFNLLALFISSLTYAEIVKDFKIIGNQRLSNESIVLFSEIEINKDYSPYDLNSSLKKLYDTNFFKKINLEIKNNTLIINVVENPIIETLEINGVKSEAFLKVLTNKMILKSRKSYVESIFLQDVNLVQNILKRNGYYFSEVKTSFVKDDAQNTIRLIYDINLGERAKIQEIVFIGDKKIKDRKLKNVITTETSRFWKFISNKKYVDEKRINLDKRLLQSYYKNRGYYNVKVENSFLEFTDKNAFKLIFKIDAGDKFKFNKISLNIPPDYNKIYFNSINKLLDELEGELYSLSKIEKILNEIDKIALSKQYDFIDADVSEKIVNNNQLDFIIQIKETDKFYVEKINIFGNNITQEEFIRNQLIVDEGDPFNVLLHNKSITKLKSKGIFGSTTSNIREGSEDGQKIVDITVTEKATGELSAGAGYGTSGATTSFGIKENNFNGKGINLSTNLSLTEESIRGIFSYTHPNFAYTDRSLTTSIESTVTDKERDYGYKSTLNSISLGTGYEQYKDLYFFPSLSIAGESLTTTASASADYKKQEGSYFDALFNYRITYDKRNSSYQPTDGFRSSFVQNLPVLSDNPNILNGYDITAYKEIIDDMVFSAGFYSRAINTLGDKDVRVSKRLFIPKSKLHGFEPGKVGPKDGADYVGGNYVTTFNTSTTVPYLLQTLENIDLKVFFDAANIWGVDYSSSIDDGSEIRSAFGAAVEVLTPVGPLSFSLSQPITKASGDVTETFRFQLGTTF